MSVGQVFSCCSQPPTATGRSNAFSPALGARYRVPTRRWICRPYGTDGHATAYRNEAASEAGPLCHRAPTLWKSEEMAAVGSSAWWCGWAPAGHQQRTVAHPGTARPHRPATVCEYHPVYDEICGYCLYIFFKQRLIIWKAFFGLPLWLHLKEHHIVACKDRNLHYSIFGLTHRTWLVSREHLIEGNMYGMISSFSPSD